MSNVSLYEYALYADSFRKSVLSGEFSDTQLRAMLENNELNSYQLDILQELAPNIQQQQQPAQAPAQQQQQYKPQQGATTKSPSQQQWLTIVKGIKQTNLVPSLKKLAQANPNDKYVTDVTNYIVQALSDLHNHLNPPAANRQPQQQQPQ